MEYKSKIKKEKMIAINYFTGYIMPWFYYDFVYVCGDDNLDKSGFMFLFVRFSLA